jgi:D-aminoacyl-tRNA deacylase
MIGLLQRVTEAHVTVDGERIGAIGRGLLVLLAVEPQDTEQDADRLIARLLGYRVFADAQGRMNLSLQDIGGGLLLVPQFTLAADTRKGARPSLSSAAPPARGRELFEYAAERARSQHPGVATGRFGADMKVSLINDGPVTCLLRTGAAGGAGPGAES